MLNIDEKKLIEELKNHFVTKPEFRDFKLEMYEFKKEVKEGFKSMHENFEKINEKLDELKASSNTLDTILEEHPIPRIERLETHLNLPKFAPAISEE